MPRIEVGADHDELVRLVGPGNFADDGEGVQVRVVERVLHVQLERDGNLLVENPDQTVVVLDGHHDLRNGRRIGGVSRSARLHEYGSAVAAARLDRGGDAFADKKRGAPGSEARICLRTARAATAGTHLLSRARRKLV